MEVLDTTIAVVALRYIATTVMSLVGGVPLVPLRYPRAGRDTAPYQSNFCRQSVSVLPPGRYFTPVFLSRTGRAKSTNGDQPGVRFSKAAASRLQGRMLKTSSGTRKRPRKES